MGLKASKQLPADQSVRGDVSGHNIIITGGTNGIGKEAARVLYRHGANIILAARDMNKCSQVVDEITANSNNNNITKNGNTAAGTIKCMECDLESFDSMKSFIQNVVKHEPQIDTLINSAGLFKAAKEYSSTTVERMMQVNYFAPFYLTVGLIGHMKPEARVLNVSGGSYKWGYPNPFLYLSPDMKTMPYFEQYATSKYALNCFTYYMNLTTEPRGVTVNAITPGLVDNDFHAEYIPAQWVKKMAKWFGRLLTVEQGAAPIVWAASTPTTRKNGGKIIHGLNIRNLELKFKDQIKLANIWKYSEDTTDVRELVRELYSSDVERERVPRERSITVEEENFARKRATPAERIEETLQPTQFAVDNKYYDPMNPDLVEVYLGRPVVNDDKLLPEGRLPNPTNFVAVWDPKTLYIFTEPDDYKYEMDQKKKTWFWGYRFPKKMKTKAEIDSEAVNNMNNSEINNTNVDVNAAK